MEVEEALLLLLLLPPPMELLGPLSVGQKSCQDSTFPPSGMMEPGDDLHEKRYYYHLSVMIDWIETVLVAWTGPMTRFQG